MRTINQKLYKPIIMSVPVVQIVVLLLVTNTIFYTNIANAQENDVAIIDLNSNSTWKCIDTEVNDWTSASFNDSWWLNCWESPTPVQDFGQAKSIWYPEKPYPETTYFRKSFSIDGNQILSGHINACIDQALTAYSVYMAIYVNNELVGSVGNPVSSTWVTRDKLDIDITQHLDIGENVIAAKVIFRGRSWRPDDIFVMSGSVRYISNVEQDTTTIDPKVEKNSDYSTSNALSTTSDEKSPNNSPIISSISVKQDKVVPGSYVTVTAEAIDIDKDNLTYIWTTKSGSITGSGESVVWNVPEKGGTYFISLEVSDGQGGSQTDSISLNVISEKLVDSSKPQQPYVDLQGHITNGIVGDEVILYLSTVNPITSPGNLIVQLTLQVPSGWSITSSGFGHGAGGLRTNTYKIEQGANERVIQVIILANEAFTGTIKGNVDYYYEGYEDSKYHDEQDLSVKIIEADDSSQVVDSENNPGGPSCSNRKEASSNSSLPETIVAWSPIGIIWMGVAGGFAFIKRKK